MQTPKGEINDKIMKLTEDEEILKKMGTAASPEECYDMVKDRLDGMSFEEFTASMSVASACLGEMKDGELSEDDLDMVAGGKGNVKKTLKAVAVITAGLPAFTLAAGTGAVMNAMDSAFGKK